MDLENVTAIAANVLISIATIIGAVAALKGLKTWQKQLRWQADHELGRRLLISTYRHRDALEGVRNPGMFLGVEPSQSSRAGGEDSYEQRLYDAERKEYEIRWEKVMEARVQLYPDLLEAEATWGPQIRILFKGILKLESDLNRTVSRHLIDKNPNNVARQRSLSAKEGDMEFNTLYRYDEKEDRFTLGLNENICEIEKYIKSRMQRSVKGNPFIF